MKTLNLHQQELAAIERGASVFIVDVEPRPLWDESPTLTKDGWVGRFFSEGYNQELDLAIPPYQPGDEVSATLKGEWPPGALCSVLITIKDVRCKQKESDYRHD